MMKPRLAAVCALALMAGVLCAEALCQAQEVSLPSKSVQSLGYDIAQEVTLVGTVLSLVPQATDGTIAGAHLLLTTLSGPVDVSLGRFSLIGKGALSIAEGQQAEITGVTKTFKGKQFFLARSVRVGDRDYAIRNERGIPITPQARQRATQNEETR
jgi:hypothetical protein